MITPLSHPIMRRLRAELEENHEPRVATLPAERLG